MLDAASVAKGAERVGTACPHDCPSGCALEVERLSATRIGRVHGSRAQTYTAGIICAKVARYAERVHHPDRLTRPLARVGAKGSGRFEAITWEAALDRIAGNFAAVARHHGPEAVWIYHSGGTMGLIQRYGIERLRNVMGYSRLHTTICSTPAEMGWRAGVGALTGVDPREMAEADLIVMWGGNPVSTQVNVMHHVARARKARGAQFAVVDCYRTPTVAQADVALILRPGTDGALAAAMIHVLLRDGLADRDYLRHLTDFDATVEAHFEAKTPAWAAAITGLDEREIVDFARLYGRTARSFLRLGFGFTRGRTGAANMHAVSCLPAVTGAWRWRGGGAFFMRWTGWGLDLTLAHGLDRVDPKVRLLDQSRIGAILNGEPPALMGGPPVHALLVQNGNPATVAPDSHAVCRGLARDDLFLVVHEQFLTRTAAFADVVLPATTFLEHDDFYCAYGNTHINLAPRVIEPLGECRSNHDVQNALATRLGAQHPGFALSAAELIDRTLRASGFGGAAECAAKGFIDRAESFRELHFLDGFPTPSGRFRFRPDWAALGHDHARLPALPDHSAHYEQADAAHPFRLVTPPARNFLNSSFTETKSSRQREGSPTLLIHPGAAATLALEDGAWVRVGNRRGSVTLTLKHFDGLQRGTLVVEGIWPDDAFPEGVGINALIGGDPVPPNGGVAFHDSKVWIEAATAKEVA